jgi:hypothetical protein
MWRQLSIIACTLAAAIAWAASPSIECPVGATLHKDRGIGGTIELLCMIDRPDGPVMHGPFLVLRPDGSVLYQGAFDEGRADGSFQRKSTRGVVESNVEYAQGRKTSESSVSPAQAVAP